MVNYVTELLLEMAYTKPKHDRENDTTYHIGGDRGDTERGVYLGGIPVPAPERPPTEEEVEAREAEDRARMFSQRLPEGVSRAQFEEITNALNVAYTTGDKVKHKQLAQTYYEMMRGY
jgi:hypothetical protein